MPSRFLTDEWMIKSRTQKVIEQIFENKTELFPFSVGLRLRCPGIVINMGQKLGKESMRFKILFLKFISVYIRFEVEVVDEGGQRKKK